MDDIHRSSGHLSAHHSFLPIKHCLWLTLLLLFSVGLSGCQPVLLLGYLITGPPKKTAPFKIGTGTDLEEGEHRILVIVSSAQSAHNSGTGVNIDVLEGLTRLIKRKEILVVRSGKVSTWIDDNGGVLDDPADLLEEFETDYIVHIVIDKFKLKEENSPSLLRSQFAGTVTAYEVQQKEDGDKKDGGEKRIQDVWDTEFSAVYPRNHPISKEKVSIELFQQQAIERLTAQLAILFYATPTSDTIQ